MMQHKQARRMAWTIVAAVMALAAGPAPGEQMSISVSAGEHDRRMCPVTFASPEAMAGKGGGWELRDEAGAVLPLQVGDKRATFLLPAMQAGSHKTFTIHPARARLIDAPAVKAEKVDGAVKFSVRGVEALRYQGEKTAMPPGFEPEFQRGGYLHPVLTPSGAAVTDDYPKNHKHHHGIWNPWTRTEFEGRHPDFWNMGEKTGTVQFVKLADVWSGDVFAGLRAEHQFVDLSAQPDPKPALNETWEIDVYDVGAAKPAEGQNPAPAAHTRPATQEQPGAAYRMFDWKSQQRTAGASPLTLPQYHYGGLGFRGSSDWNNGKDSLAFLTSEGKTRENGNETRARWIRISGKIGGKPASVAILSHPDNFRAPQPVRLHPTEPFACFAPQQLGEFKIEPDRPYVARYRFIIADGEISADEINRLWNDYAHPPQVGKRGKGKGEREKEKRA